MFSSAKRQIACQFSAAPVCRPAVLYVTYYTRKALEYLHFLWKRRDFSDSAPDFHLTNKELKEITLKDTSGKRIFVIVPSVDTPVCDREVRRFNEEAAKLNNVSIYVVSMDLPFAQSRWCGSAGIDKVTILSDYKNRDFGKNYGVYIKELGLLTRAIIIVDENNKVSYVEYCNEVSSEPDYEAALNAVK